MDPSLDPSQLTTGPVTQLSLALVALWTVGVILYALAKATSATADPAPPEPPEDHHH